MTEPELTAKVETLEEQLRALTSEFAIFMRRHDKLMFAQRQARLAEVNAIEVDQNYDVTTSQMRREFKRPQQR